MNLWARFRRLLNNKYVYIALLLGIGVAWTAYSHFWVKALPESTQSVEAKWNAAIRDLGVEPVYPPEEDIEVGDVFAIVSYDSIPENGVVDSAIANHAVRLWRMDLSKDIDNNYKDVYIFGPSGRSTINTLLSAPNVSTVSASDTSESSDGKSIFKLNDYRINLPLATFPKFVISKNRAAETRDILEYIGFRSASQSESKTEVSIKNTQTYGIPYLVAQRALVSFCDDLFPPMCEESAVRRVLSTRIGGQIYDIGIDKKTRKPKYRMTVELGLINRVFLTQKIETNLVRNQGFNIGGGQDIFVNVKGKTQKDGLSRTLENGSTKEKLDVVGDTGDPALDKGGEQFGSAEDESELAVAFDGHLLDRPVVFGFESVRFSPKASPILMDATVAGEPK
jgi:hypothetical protein